MQVDSSSDATPRGSNVSPNQSNVTSSRSSPTQQAPVTRGRSAQDITRELKYTTLKIGCATTNKIKASITEWENLIKSDYKERKYGFFKRTLYKDSEAVKVAKKEIKHLKKLDKDIDSLKTSLSKTKKMDKGWIKKIETISSKILTDAKDVMKTDELFEQTVNKYKYLKEALNRDDHIFSCDMDEILSPYKNFDALPVDDDENHNNLSVENHDDVLVKNFDYKKNLRIIRGGVTPLKPSLAEASNSIKELKIANDERIKSIKKEILSCMEIAKKENGEIANPTLTQDEINARTTKLSELIGLQKKVEQLDKIDPHANRGTLGALDSFQILDAVELELGKILTAYDIVKGKTQLQKNIKNSGLPQPMQSHWQSKLNAIKSNSEKKQLAALEELSKNFGEFLAEYVSKQNSVAKLYADSFQILNLSTADSSLFPLKKATKDLEILHKKISTKKADIDKEMERAKTVAELKGIEKRVLDLSKEIARAKNIGEALQMAPDIQKAFQVQRASLMRLANDEANKAAPDNITKFLRNRLDRVASEAQKGLVNYASALSKFNDELKVLEGGVLIGKWIVEENKYLKALQDAKADPKKVNLLKEMKKGTDEYLNEQLNSATTIEESRAALEKYFGYVNDYE